VSIRLLMAMLMIRFALKTKLLGAENRHYFYAEAQVSCPSYRAASGFLKRACACDRTRIMIIDVHFNNNT